MTSQYNIKQKSSPTEHVLPQSDVALVLVDFINPLNFKGSQALAGGAVQAARNTAGLKNRLLKQKVPVIYANDNYGLWQSDFKSLVASCASQPGEVGEMTQLLAPGPRDIAILKPRHSAFYGTPLELLLDQMKVKKLILAGLATDICIQMTAMDAYLRAYETWVPSDCTAAEGDAAKQEALQYMQEILKCHIEPALSSSN